MATKSKGLIRSLNRRGAKTAKVKPAEARRGRLKEPTACEKCGAIFAKRTWRRDHKMTLALLDKAGWAVCPACEQAKTQEYWGRVVIRGAFPAAHEIAIRERIANVADRAQATQPERRLVSVDRQGDEIEVLTTSQKLAHRIVHELKKAFRGRATYAWSDDGSLFATWQRESLR